MDHELEAVADPEDRDAEGKDTRIHPGTGFFIDARRASGQDYPFGFQVSDGRQGYVRGFDLAIDMVLPDPPGDELVVLGTEINDKDQGDAPFKL